MTRGREREQRKSFAFLETPLPLGKGGNREKLALDPLLVCPPIRRLRGDADRPDPGYR